MIFSFEPPADWNNKVDNVFQTVEFASCLKMLNQTVIFGKSPNSQVTISLVGSNSLKTLLSRANIYCSNVSKSEVVNIKKHLKKLGIPFMRIGNTMTGPTKNLDLDLPIKRHTFILNLSTGVEQIWEKFSKKARNAVRKSEKAGVKVRQLKTLKDIEKYCSLSNDSGIRIRQKRKTYSLYPSSFFKEVFSVMVPEGMAKFVGAFYKDSLIAGGLFLVYGNRSIYYHGASKRLYSKMQGPSAIQWFNILDSKKQGTKLYDLGGSTPGLDSNDSRYFVHKFKKQWGGESSYFYNKEIILSKYAYWVQDKIISKIWMYAQPAINKIINNE